MEVRLPIPKNWQDFESICHRLWAEIWSDLNAHKNGRQGQPQCGVDIFGKPIYSKSYHGVQCKDKDNRLGSILTGNDLLEESQKSKDFTPQISSFTLATTSQRDQQIQSLCRQVNEEKRFPFNVDVWSWDDIEAEIAYRPQILNHYYSSLPISETESCQSSVKLSRHSTKDHFYAFFTRPQIRSALSSKFLSYLTPLVYELVDNAYTHGNAGQYEIVLKGNTIQLKDNGAPFNSLEQLDASKASSKGNIGSFVLRSFLDRFEDGMKVSYGRKHKHNVLKLVVNRDVLNIEDDTFFEMTVDLKDAYGRENARSLASTIPLDKSELVINVTDIFNISVFVEFTREVLNRMKPEQKLTMSLPRHEYLSRFESWFNDSRLNIKMR